MNFVGSVKTCFTKYVDFSGRSSRSEFWYFTLFIILIGICADIIDASLVGQSYFSYDDYFGPVASIFNVLTFLPALAVSIRRLHDINKSGWWCLISLTIIGLIPLTYWYIKPSDKNSNVFGNATSENLNNNKIYQLPKWIKFFLIPLISFIFLTLISLGIFYEIGYLPQTEVISGNDLHKKHKTALINHNIINKDDKIYYFYSEGLFSILDGGQLITQDKLISYEKNDDQILEVVKMKLKNIKDIVLQEEGSYFSDSIYKIIGNDQSEYEYLFIFLSEENGGEKKFIDYLKKKIN